MQVTIPPGVEDGQILRLRGKGAPSPGEGEPGDALVQIVVRPHRFFTREGDNILLDLPITVKEAALGAEVRTPTTTGSVMLKIPKRSNTGDMLRLRGKGVKKRAGAGDELVKLKVMMPTEAEPELEAFLADWTPASTLRSAQGDVSHDHGAGVSANARGSIGPNAVGLDRRGMAHPRPGRRTSSPSPIWIWRAPT